LYHITDPRKERPVSLRPTLPKLVLTAGAKLHIVPPAIAEPNSLAARWGKLVSHTRVTIPHLQPFDGPRSIPAPPEASNRVTGPGEIVRLFVLSQAVPSHTRTSE